MTIREILNRGLKLPESIKAARVELKSYPTTPFSALTARSDHAANDRFTEDPNEYTNEEAEFIQMLLDNMSESAKRTVMARVAARQNPTR